MKNIIKGFFMAALMSLAFTSCEDEAEIPGHGPVDDPKEITAGVYQGTWTQQEVGKTEIKEAQGSITFAPGTEAYTTNVTVDCTEFNLAKSATANITPGGVGYMFHNPLQGNGLGNIFSGTISKEGVATINYRLTVPSGRKKYTYIYNFTGSKSAQN